LSFDNRLALRARDVYMILASCPILVLKGDQSSIRAALAILSVVLPIIQRTSPWLIRCIIQMTFAKPVTE